LLQVQLRSLESSFARNNVISIPQINLTAKYYIPTSETLLIRIAAASATADYEVLENWVWGLEGQKAKSA
jgi:hypothetical protein